MATQRQRNLPQGEVSSPEGTGQDELPSYGEATEGATPSPPGYATQDPTAGTYLLQPPFIYTCATGGGGGGGEPAGARKTPAYLLWRLSSGRPSQLGIRRLKPGESRRLSLRGPVEENALGHKVPTVRYDDGAGLYVIRSMRLFGSPEHEIEGVSEGAGGRTLSGIVRFEAPGCSYDAGYLGLRENDSGRFWHETKNEVGRRRTDGYHRYGCQPPPPPARALYYNRQLLFSVEKKGSLWGWKAPRSCEWRDRQGRLLAVEGRGGDRLEMTGELLAGGQAEGTRSAARRQVMREALLTCWVGKAMASGSLKWNQS